MAVVPQERFTQALIMQSCSSFVKGDGSDKPLLIDTISDSAITSVFYQQDHGVAGDAAVLAQTVHFLVRLGLQVDGRRVGLQQRTQVVPDRVLHRGQLRTLGNDGCIEVAKRVAVFLHEPHRLPHKHIRVSPLPLGIIVGEQLADVRHRQSTKQRIRDAMQQDVPITMCHTSPCVWHADAPNDEGVSLLQAMQVEAMAHTEG
eukprot:CAMPEP_0206140288 /NCGR_PEP_ID=MMETSP1473-20131121/8925_1 /ASSEMBLY_ACC=CAM_ASM_001109 /TAXON_ID=1461547 /ORGANISM="Stichococcus sp, Strain RCC1054" /LENGTH=201 /DNA_ID=CAMNT_0053534385 /DNA_START=195 /DNA_END=801 /DNA_ORIENTATION=-